MSHTSLRAVLLVPCGAGAKAEADAARATMVAADFMVDIKLVIGENDYFGGSAPWGLGGDVIRIQIGNIYPYIQQLYPYMPYYRTL